MKIDWNKIDYKVPQAKRDFEKIVRPKSSKEFTEMVKS